MGKNDYYIVFIIVRTRNSQFQDGGIITSGDWLKRSCDLI